jgi:hypothetical protein
MIANELLNQLVVFFELDVVCQRFPAGMDEPRIFCDVSGSALLSSSTGGRYLSRIFSSQFGRV